jgi:serine/threonine-protein phosphatase CPPED1
MNNNDPRLCWQQEIDYSYSAIEKINSLDPRPLFCCVCGDLVDMTSLIFAGTAKYHMQQQQQKEELWTEEECDQLQEAQYTDFKRVWSLLHPDIALVCLCGNHDVGNRPTKLVSFELKA